VYNKEKIGHMAYIKTHCSVQSSIESKNNAVHTNESYLLTVRRSDDRILHSKYWQVSSDE